MPVWLKYSHTNATPQAINKREKNGWIMQALFVCLLLYMAVPVAAQRQTAIDPAIATDKKIIDGFMDKRFGMFIHWGPVALRGTEIGWSRSHQVPTEEYDNLYKEFNPVLFNADEWVAAAKNAGMKYLTITAKHHDGFCLWPTAYSDYNISNSPFRRDVVGELAEACKKQGIAFCIYFTVLDWHDPYYPLHRVPGDTLPDPNADMDKFVTRMKNELRELITRYKPYMLWFDGNWEQPWTLEYGKEVYAYIKSLDPSVIINNRLGKGKHTELGPQTVGDYTTPEQFIGALNMDQPWESCITICKQWAWKPNDQMKSRKECVQTLVRTAAGNGNLLFNVGPMLDGRIEARQISRLKEMGDWLKLNGEAIYGTKGGPYKPNDKFAATRKGNNLYLHVFSADNNQLSLPPLKGVRIRKARLLGGGSVQFTQHTNRIVVKFSSPLPDEDCSVVVLELDKNAETIPVIE